MEYNIKVIRLSDEIIANVRNEHNIKVCNTP